jgi:hypothetical protein
MGEVFHRHAPQTSKSIDNSQPERIVVALSRTYDFFFPLEAARLNQVGSSV